MKVLQTIQGLSALSGGPSTCTRDLMVGLEDIHANVDLLTAKCKDPNEHNLGEGSRWLMEVENDFRTPLALSKNFRTALELSDYDIYHNNALWMYSNHITCKTARKKGKPYIISTHGMLYPTALKIKRWKKWPMLKLWFNEDIHKAACLHATCEQEKKYCRDFGYKGPIAVIPNPVVFPEGVELATSKPEQKSIGFLGRLHPIKKIENLFQGAAIAIQQGCEPFTIEIMGKGSDEYETSLRQEAKRLGIEKMVHFVGFVNGKDKYDRLGKLHALMVPSAQENFGMIVPEALICGTPVYASLGTPWAELNDYDCGWWRDNSPEIIAKTIREIMDMPKEKILRMGANGRKLMEQKYEQHKVAGMMSNLYKWILGEVEKLEYIYK